MSEGWTLTPYEAVHPSLPLKARGLSGGRWGVPLQKAEVSGGRGGKRGGRGRGEEGEGEGEDGCNVPTEL